jgi:hypothetical protein
VSRAAQRLRDAVQALDPDQRFAAAAAVGLLFTMFLPWYEKSVVVMGSTSFAHETINAFGAVSFVEAAIFLVAAGVLVLVFARAERKQFHLPGGDGTVIFGAGLWAAALIFYRVFDRPNVSGDAGTVGIQWGFFVAFVAAGALAYAGRRIQAAHRPEPESRPRDPRPSPSPPPPRAAAVPGEEETEVVTLSKRPTNAVRGEQRRDRGITRDDARQLTFDDPPREPPVRPGEFPRAREGG